MVGGFHPTTANR